MKLLLVLLLLVGTLTQPDSVVAAPMPGDQLPSISLTSASGGTRPVWNKGHITVVAFCAFWCDTWKEQSRRMTDSQSALRGLPVMWTMISVDGRWADKSREKSWGQIARDARLDTGGRWTNQLGIHSVPTTLVVDGEGRVRYSAQGIARSQVLLQIVRGLVSGKSAASSAAPLRLVFDDFPSNNAHLDDILLDTLRALNLRATFCGSIKRRQSSPTITRRARQEGHMVQGAFGAAPRGVVDPFDWKRPGEEEMCRRVLCAVAPGKTILLHAGVRETVQALPGLLRSLIQRGYRFR